MSGKCPNCKRMVKSETQICTPNATPPASPWRVALTSPLRSPFRSPRRSPGTGATPKDVKSAGTWSPIRSPPRSPFKSMFGAGDGKDKGGEIPRLQDPEAQVSSRAEGRRSRSPVRGISRSPSRSPTRSPWNAPPSSMAVGGGTLEPRPGPSAQRSSRSPLPRGPDSQVPTPTGGAFFNGPRHAEEPPVAVAATAHAAVATAAPRSRSLSPVRVSFSDHANTAPHSPLRSPYKGSFFERSRNTVEDEASVGRAGIEERPRQQGRSRSRSPLRSPFRSPFSPKGLRSPLQSPFSRPSSSETAPMGTE